MVAQNIIQVDEEVYEEIDDLFGKPVTKAQIAIIRLVADGMRAQDVATSLKLSKRTVETQLSLIYRRLGIHNVTSLVLWATRNGII